MSKKVISYLVLFVISLWGISLGADTTTILYPLDDELVSANAHVEIATFAGSRKKYLISQAFYNMAKRQPNFLAFRVLALEGQSLVPIWNFEPDVGRFAFSVGDPFNRGTTQLLFTHWDDPNTRVKAVNSEKQVEELLSVPGNVEWIEVADIDHDGENEIVVASITKQYHELFEGYIAAYRWDGTMFKKVATLTPEERGGYRSFRLLDINGDGRVDLVVNELTQNGDLARAFTYSHAQRAFMPIVDEKLTGILDELYSANIVVVSHRDERFLLAAKAGIVVYSLTDAKFLRKIDLPHGFLTQGDLDNDGVDEIILMSLERKDDPPLKAKIWKIHLLEIDELFEKLTLAKQGNESAYEKGIAQVWQYCASDGFVPERCDRAITKVEADLKQHPPSGDAYVALCLAYWNKSFERDRYGQTQKALRKKAVSLCHEAIKVDPRNPEAHYSLALYTQDSEQRLIHLRKAAALNPNHPDAHELIARILLDRGEIDEAIAEYRLHLAVSPHRGRQSGFQHFNFAGSLAHVGHTKEAVEIFERALDLEPQRIERCFLVERMDLEPYARFKDFVERVERLRPYCTNVEHRNRAVSLMNKGKTEEAVKEFELQLRVNPYHQGSYFLLRDLYLEQGDRAKADETGMRYLKHETDVVERCRALRRLGTLRMQRPDNQFIERLAEECESQKRTKKGDLQGRRKVEQCRSDCRGQVLPYIVNHSPKPHVSPTNGSILRLRCSNYR